MGEVLTGNFGGEGKNESDKKKRKSIELPEDQKITFIRREGLVDEVELSKEEKEKKIADLIITKATLLSRKERVQSSLQELRPGESPQRTNLEILIDEIDEIIGDVDRGLKKLGFTNKAG